VNFFNIYLPVAGIHFNVLLLIAIGFCVGIIGGFFGVGGGWIITPALNIFGFHIAYAIGTGLANIFGQPIGAIRQHHKMDTVDWKPGTLSIFTSLLGFEAGSRVVMTLEEFGDAGTFMFYDYFVLRLRNLIPAGSKVGSATGDGKANTVSGKLHQIKIPPMISFPVSDIEHVSLWIVASIFLLTGFISGILGIGGGFIILPALVYLSGLPTSIAVGASLMTVLVTAALGCLVYGLDGRVEIGAAAFACRRVGRRTDWRYGCEVYSRLWNQTSVCNHNRFHKFFRDSRATLQINNSDGIREPIWNYSVRNGYSDGWYGDRKDGDQIEKGKRNGDRVKIVKQLTAESIE
jgi:uncharacterized membrane protein YfcA